LSVALVEAERERDRVERRFVLVLGYRNGESRSIGLPLEREKRAALPLNCDRLEDKLGVYAAIEINDQAASGPLDHPRKLPGNAVSLLLQPQSALAERATPGQRERVVKIHTQQGTPHTPRDAPVARLGHRVLPTMVERRRCLSRLNMADDRTGVLLDPPRQTRPHPTRRRRWERRDDYLVELRRVPHLEHGMQRIDVRRLAVNLEASPAKT
jgi:hypothetical protein